MQFDVNVMGLLLINIYVIAMLSFPNTHVSMFCIIFIKYERGKVEYMCMRIKHNDFIRNIRIHML